LQFIQKPPFGTLQSLGQVVEQGFRVLHVGGVESFGESFEMGQEKVIGPRPRAPLTP
jgi:hypothetical protein